MIRHCIVCQDSNSGLWAIEFYENGNHRQIATTANYHDFGSWISNWIANSILPY